MVILAGLEAFLGPLGAILAPLGVILAPLGWKSDPGSSGSRISGGRRNGAQVRPERKERARSAQAERFGTPPPPKALAKAKATTIMSLLAN